MREYLLNGFKKSKNYIKNNLIEMLIKNLRKFLMGIISLGVMSFIVGIIKNNYMLILSVSIAINIILCIIIFYMKKKV